MKNLEQTKIFVDQLENHDLIKTEDIALLENQPTPEDVFDTLILQGVADVKLSEAYARFRGVPFVHLHEISHQARGILDDDLMRRFGFIPFCIDPSGKNIQVAITDPRKLIHLDEHKLGKLSKKIGYRIEVVMAAKSQAEKALEGRPTEFTQPISASYQEPKPVTSESAQTPAETVLSSSLKSIVNSVDLDLIKNLANQSDHASLTLAILKFSFDKGAEEIIFDPFERKIVLRLKIDGVSHNIIVLPITLLEGIFSQIAELSGINEEVPSTGILSIGLGSEAPTEILTSVLPTIFGNRIYLKFLKDAKNIPTLEKLGLFEKSRDKIEQAVASGFGLTLIAGSSASGKTTTLYALSEHLARKGLDIIMIESSPSYRFAEITQVETKPEIGFDSAQALRSALTQSPDVVVIDSIVDSQSAKYALEAALNGKVVLCGMYAKTASQALKQFAELSQEPYLLSSALRLVIAQSLVRKICQKCKVEVRVSETAEEKVRLELNTEQNLRFYKGGICPGCKNGFKGRIGIFEILDPTPEILDKVIAGASEDSIFHEARRSGMISMRQDGLLKVVSGLTTIDEVIKNTKSEG